MKISQPHPKITIYDDVFCWNDQVSILRQLESMPYFIGWNDTSDNTEMFMHARFFRDEWVATSEHGSDADLFNMLRRTEAYSTLENSVEDNTVGVFEKLIVNCTTIGDVNSHHCHKGQDVLLYYANLEWRNEWMGETFFYDDMAKDIIHCAPYTPNRIIKFSGDLVHRFGVPSRTAPKFRFSISTFFNRTELIQDVYDNSDALKDAPKVEWTPSNDLKSIL